MYHDLAERHIAARATVLATVYAAHPERFLSGLPQPPACTQEVWIPPPRMCVTEGGAQHDGS